MDFGNGQLFHVPLDAWVMARVLTGQWPPEGRLMSFM